MLPEFPRDAGGGGGAREDVRRRALLARPDHTASDGCFTAGPVIAAVCQNEVHGHASQNRTA